MQSGKTITVENPYVVNGLQTSTEIYKYFKDANTEGDERSVQVKIVVTTEPKSWDRIISASNKQTNIPNASLHATEQIHRDIEDFLKPYQIYYDRRKNFYKNEGKPIDKIISIGQLAQAVMAVMLQRPNDARARPSSLLKRDEDYEAVFSSKYDLRIYQVCASVLKKVDAFIKSEQAGLESRDRNNVKFHLAMLAAMRVVGKKRVNRKDMNSIEVDQIDQKLLGHCLDSVYQKYRDLGGTDQVAKGAEFRDSLIAEFSSGATGG